MNEDLHIEKAAHLADKLGAEKLDTERARNFVAKSLASKEMKASDQVKGLSVRRFIYAWGGIALAVAACVAVAAIIFRPFSPRSGNGGYGTPVQLLENNSIHAGTEILDSLETEKSDTLSIETIIVPIE